MRPVAVVDQSGVVADHGWYREMIDSPSVHFVGSGYCFDCSDCCSGCLADLAVKVE